MRFGTAILLIVFFHLFGAAQQKVDYGLFQHTYSLLNIVPATPQTASLGAGNNIISYGTQNIQPFAGNTVPGSTQGINFPGNSTLPGLPDELTLLKQRAEAENDIKEWLAPKREENSIAATNSYRLAYNHLTELNPDDFSISKAVFYVENAYFDNKLSYVNLEMALKERAEIVRQLLVKKHLNVNDNLALNYGIQKMYSQPNELYSAKYKRSVTVPPFKYDFEDFRGEKDYSKMFVYKMLVTGKGQCHSMPLLYLMIAEQLGAKANLSLAPQHSFIQFPDNAGRMVNFETTNGNLVSNAWLIQSGFITAKALQNKTYLDTLSQRQLYAQILGDLLLGYLSKFKYDSFAEQIRQTILQVNPLNLTALIVDANLKTQIAMQKIKEAGMPKPENLHNFPDAYNAYLNMQRQ